MQGQLANLIALAAHGNAYLSYADEDALARARTQFGVTYIRPEVVFSHGEGLLVKRERVVARAFDEWLLWLRRVKAERLDYIAFAWRGDAAPGLTESVAASFSGGVAMAIQAHLPGARYELWRPEWTVDRSDGEHVWRVAYKGFPSPSDLRVPFSTADAADRLSAALAAAAEFSDTHGVEQPWAGIFRSSLALLESGGAVDESPMAPLPRRGYSPEARRLLASADRAWVFGGMGSWNDLGWQEPDAQQQYGAVTHRLYEAVKMSVVASVNSFDPILAT